MISSNKRKYWQDGLNEEITKSCLLLYNSNNTEPVVFYAAVCKNGLPRELAA